jgi:hypothetical protein
MTFVICIAMLIRVGIEGTVIQIKSYGLDYHGVRDRVPVRSRIFSPPYLSDRL